MKLPTSRARILIVDDKENFLALFRRILPSDLEVTCVTNGVQAFHLLTQESFDVMVTDVRMPGTDGMTLLEKVRAAGIDVDVILMTAYGTIADAVRAMKFGASDYITKPFEPDAVVLAIERALARRAGLATSSTATAATEPATGAAGAAGATGATGATAATEATPSSPPQATGVPLTSLPYREAIAAERERATREYLVALLREVEGNVTQAAERAGIERESFHRLMKRHGIRAEDFRGAK